MGFIQELGELVHDCPHTMPGAKVELFHRIKSYLETYRHD